MGILDGVAAEVAAAVADIFEDATHQFTGGQVSDGRGGTTRSTTTQTVQAFVTDYKDYVRATAGIPSNERKVMVVANGLSNLPGPDDVLVQGEEAWQVIEVSRDPASAIYTCRCRPVAVPSGVNLVLLLAPGEAVASALSSITLEFGLDATAAATPEAGSDISVAFDLNVPISAVASAQSGLEVTDGVELNVPISATAQANADFAINQLVELNAPISAIASVGAELEIGGSIDLDAGASATAGVGSELSIEFGIDAPIAAAANAESELAIGIDLNEPAQAQASAGSDLSVASGAAAVIIDVSSTVVVTSGAELLIEPPAVAGDIAAALQAIIDAGGKAGWLNSQDITGMRTARDGSGGVPSVGDEIGWVADSAQLGGKTAAEYVADNSLAGVTALPGIPFIPYTDGARPILRQIGDYYYFEHDGSADIFAQATPGYNLQTLLVMAAAEERSVGTDGAGLVTFAPATGRDWQETNGASINWGSSGEHLAFETGASKAFTSGTGPSPLNLWEVQSSGGTLVTRQNGLDGTSVSHTPDATHPGDLIIGARYNNGLDRESRTNLRGLVIASGAISDTDRDALRANLKTLTGV